MKLGELIELMAIVSVHSPILIEGKDSFPDSALDRYLKVATSQASDWLESLDALPDQISNAPPSQHSALWKSSEPLLVDVFAGGLVSRVWGAVLTASDRQRKTLSAERAARTVLARHDQAQQRLLRMMVDGPYLTLERVVALDRIRRKIERWSDLLIGHLVRRFALADFAYDCDRALDFGEEQLRHFRGSRQDQIWDLYFVCLRSAFPEVDLAGGAREQRRDEVLRAILACLPARLFLDDGMLMSTEVRRILDGSSSEGPPAADDVDAAIYRLPRLLKQIDRQIERRGWIAPE